MQKFHEEVKNLIDREFTIYGMIKYICSDSKIPSMLPYAGTDGKYKYLYNGLTSHVVVDNLGGIYIGHTFCSSKDTFNKKVGRCIAKGRAYKALAIAHDLVSKECPLVDTFVFIVQSKAGSYSRPSTVVLGKGLVDQDQLIEGYNKRLSRRM